ncbi:MAG: glycosyltransferase [Dysosmobacter sp.]|nr:glycosyltransferase [Dysosmobacter sp.]MDY3866261.1 glycosyltransferase [Dysosmobacter sp.]
METKREDPARVWIIIPVYNAEKTLQKCLDSVLRQTYPAWTACLVDDGSKDGSAALAQQYIARDARFRWFPAERNSGPSATRNRGLAAAQGEYLAFLDSDDWWDDTFLEEMVTAAQEHQADFVQCAWTLEWPGGASRPEPNAYDTLRVFDRAGFGGPLTRMLSGIDLNHVARKLVRRELAEGLTFAADLATAEDLWMCFQLLMRAQRICFIPRPLYHYYRHGAGLTGGGLSFQKKWNANREVSRRMLAGLRGTEFDTPRFRFLARVRPFRLIFSKAVRLIRDKLSIRPGPGRP